MKLAIRPKTDHGGRQFKFPVEREPCESKYGLCE
jgi:hypothetical protein